jgi:hypothetical protein
LLREIKGIEKENEKEIQHQSKKKQDLVLAAWKLRYYIEYLRLISLQHVVEVLEEKNTLLEKENAETKQTNTHLINDLAYQQENRQMFELSIQDLKEVIQQNETTIKQLEATISHQSHTQQQHDQQVQQIHETYQDQINKLQRDLDHFEENRQELIVSKLTCQEILKLSLQKDHQIESLQSQVDANAAQLYDITCEKEQLQMRITDLENEKQAALSTGRQLNDQIDAQNDSLFTLQTQIDDLLEEKENLNKSIEQLKSEKQHLVEKDIPQLKSEKQSLQSLLKDVMMQLSEKEAQYLKETEINQSKQTTIDELNNKLQEKEKVIEEYAVNEMIYRENIVSLQEIIKELLPSLENSLMKNEDFYERMRLAIVFAEKKKDYSKFLEEELFQARHYSEVYKATPFQQQTLQSFEESQSFSASTSRQQQQSYRGQSAGFQPPSTAGYDLEGFEQFEEDPDEFDHLLMQGKNILEAGESVVVNSSQLLGESSEVVEDMSLISHLLETIINDANMKIQKLAEKNKPPSSRRVSRQPPAENAPRRASVATQPPRKASVMSVAAAAATAPPSHPMEEKLLSLMRALDEKMSSMDKVTSTLKVLLEERATTGPSIEEAAAAGTTTSSPKRSNNNNNNDDCERLTHAVSEITLNDFQESQVGGVDGKSAASKPIPKYSAAASTNDDNRSGVSKIQAVEDQISLEKLMIEMKLALEDIKKEFEFQAENIKQLTDTRKKLKLDLLALNQSIAQVQQQVEALPEEAEHAQLAETVYSLQQQKNDLLNQIKFTKNQLSMLKENQIILNSKAIELQSEMFHLHNEIRQNAQEFVDFYQEAITSYYPTDLVPVSLVETPPSRKFMRFDSSLVSQQSEADDSMFNDNPLLLTKRIGVDTSIDFTNNPPAGLIDLPNERADSAPQRQSSSPDGEGNNIRGRAVESPSTLSNQVASSNASVANSLDFNNNQDNFDAGSVSSEKKSKSKRRPSMKKEKSMKKSKKQQQQQQQEDPSPPPSFAPIREESFSRPHTTSATNEELVAPLEHSKNNDHNNNKETAERPSDHRKASSAVAAAVAMTSSLENNSLETQLHHEHHQLPQRPAVPMNSSLENASTVVADHPFSSAHAHPQPSVAFQTPQKESVEAVHVNASPTSQLTVVRPMTNENTPRPFFNTKTPKGMKSESFQKRSELQKKQQQLRSDYLTEKNDLDALATLLYNKIDEMFILLETFTEVSYDILSWKESFYDLCGYYPDSYEAERSKVYHNLSEAFQETRHQLQEDVFPSYEQLLRQNQLKLRIVMKLQEELLFLQQQQLQQQSFHNNNNSNNNNNNSSLGYQLIEREDLLMKYSFPLIDTLLHDFQQQHPQLPLLQALLRDSSGLVGGENGDVNASLLLQTFILNPPITSSMLENSMEFDGSNSVDQQPHQQQQQHLVEQPHPRGGLEDSLSLLQDDTVPPNHHRHQQQQQQQAEPQPEPEQHEPSQEQQEHIVQQESKQQESTTAAESSVYTFSFEEPEPLVSQLPVANPNPANPSQSQSQGQSHSLSQTPQRKASSHQEHMPIPLELKDEEPSKPRNSLLRLQQEQQLLEEKERERKAEEARRRTDSVAEQEEAEEEAVSMIQRRHEQELQEHLHQQQQKEIHQQRVSAQAHSFLSGTMQQIGARRREEFEEKQRQQQEQQEIAAKEAKEKTRQLSNLHAHSFVSQMFSAAATVSATPSVVEPEVKDLPKEDPVESATESHQPPPISLPSSPLLHHGDEESTKKKAQQEQIALNPVDLLDDQSTKKIEKEGGKDSEEVLAGSSLVLGATTLGEGSVTSTAEESVEDIVSKYLKEQKKLLAAGEIQPLGDDDNHSQLDRYYSQDSFEKLEGNQLTGQGNAIALEKTSDHGDQASQHSHVSKQSSPIQAKQDHSFESLHNSSAHPPPVVAAQQVDEPKDDDLVSVLTTQSKDTTVPATLVDSPDISSSNSAKKTFNPNMVYSSNPQVNALMVEYQQIKFELKSWKDNFVATNQREPTIMDFNNLPYDLKVKIARKNQLKKMLAPYKTQLVVPFPSD